MTETIKKQKIKPAAWFLIIIIAILVLMFAGRIWWEADPNTPMRWAFTPNKPIAEEQATPAPDYSKDDAWFQRPSMSNKYATMRPDGPIKGDKTAPLADVFMIHPTSGFSNKRWNAAYDDQEANVRTDMLSIKFQLSPFHPNARLFAPKYRQANFGAFFDESGQNLTAFKTAYADVVAAFDYYIKHHNNGRPFFIASHSQGTLHAIPLLLQRVKGTPAGKRMIASYLIGWPVSVQADIPALGFKACNSPTDTSCLISWQTFGAGGDAKMLKSFMDTTVGFTGQPRKGTKMLCTNPLNWTVDGTGTQADHKGAVEMTIDDKPMTPIIPAPFGASCDDDGALKLDRIMKGNAWEQYQMTGLNMHAYDFNLFYMNLRENIQTRIGAWFDKDK